MSTTKASLQNQAADILAGVGGPGNIASMTHCATRLRFELNDASLADKERLEANPKVMGAVPQGGNHYQVIVGGDVATVYNAINKLPEMADRSVSNEELKKQQRDKAKGKMPWLDAFFEYLSDSFRPILGVLLGASDAAYLRNLTLFSLIGVALPIILASGAFGWGLTGIWVGQLGQVLVRLVGVVLRFRSMRWAVTDVDGKQGA